MRWASSKPSSKCGPSIKKRLLFLRPRAVCSVCNLLIRGLDGLVISTISPPQDLKKGNGRSAVHKPARACERRSYHFLVFLLLDGLQRQFDQGAECGLIIHRHLGENLAIHVNVSLMNSMHQCAIAHSMHARCRIDTRNPQTAHITFAV